jgi:hypothetical protein
MKTVIIYDQVFEQPISFYVVEGDVSHLDGVYGNSAANTEAQENELYAIVFNEDWSQKPALDKFPVDVVAQGAKVIVCGFLP